MKDYLSKQEDNMLALLEELVNIDSGSYYKEGIDRVGSKLKEEYEKIGFEAKVFEEKEYGNNILLQHQDATDPKLLILLHMDTVFAEGTSTERPYKREGDTAYGPGVIDMKGSHVAALYAIKALLEKGSETAKELAVLLTSDEEIGAPSARPLIEEQAQGKDAVIVMEPARQDGSIVTARRGGGRYTVSVEGKAAHAGMAPEKGRSAVEELAHKIIKLHALSDLDAGISVNAGIIEGGTTVNTIAPHARAYVDIRITYQDQAEKIEQQIKDVCATVTVEGTKTTLEGGVNRPPMERNEETIELLEKVQASGEEIGLNVTEIATGGSSDASFTSALGVPTIDGMGPVGGNQHSDQEYLEIPTLTERTHLLANFIEKI